MVTFETVPSYVDINSGRITWNNNFQLAQEEFKKIDSIVDTSNLELDLHTIKIEDSTLANNGVQIYSTDASVHADILVVNDTATIDSSLIISGKVGTNVLTINNGVVVIGQKSAANSEFIMNGNITINSGVIINDSVKYYNAYSDTEIKTRTTQNEFIIEPGNSSYVVVNCSNYTDSCKYKTKFRISPPVSGQVGRRCTIIFKNTMLSTYTKPFTLNTTYLSGFSLNMKGSSSDVSDSTTSQEYYIGSDAVLELVSNITTEKWEVLNYKNFSNSNPYSA